MNRVLKMIGLTALAIGAATSCNSESSKTDSIDERAAQVMPFDLELTSHTYAKTAEGGLQKVVADDPNEREQITLIQDHLVDEAAKFSEGDFSDPARIHGMDMPGLSELEAGFARIRVEYSPHPDGGTIIYTSDEPALVTAIHSWFDRQTADHG